MRILIVDSNSLISDAIETLLEKKLGFEIAGITQLNAKSPPATRKRIDLAVIYLGFQAVEALRQMARILKQLDVPAVVISANASKEHAAQVLQTGVQGLVLQSASTAELESAIRSVVAGKLFLSPSLPAAARQFAKKSLDGERTPFERLTDRQRSILKLIAEGKNTKEIAHRLKVSAKTVEFHRVRLMNRLGIFNVPSLVRFAIRCGLARFDA